jgi:hypothetical protein
VRLELRQDRAVQEVWLSGTLDVSSYGENDRDRLRKFITTTAGIERVGGDAEHLCFESAPVHYRQSPQTVLRKPLVEQLRKHLWTEQTANGFRYYLGCDKSFTAQVASNFAIMFTLGMIVRYTPELIGKLEGEWLVHEYLATQPLQFAYLLGSGLARNEIIPAHLSYAQAV